MQTIGERVRQEREQQKLSRAALAKAAGIAPTTLSDLELGLSKSTTKLHRVAERLGVQVRWLETGEGPKHPASARPRVNEPAGQYVAPAPDWTSSSPGHRRLARALDRYGALLSEQVVDSLTGVIESVAAQARPSPGDYPNLPGGR